MIVVDCRPHLPRLRLPSPSGGAVINRSTAAVAIYIALADRRRVVWDKVLEGSNLIFEYTLISLKHSVAWIEESL